MRPVHAILIFFALLLPSRAWSQTRWAPYSSEVSFKIKNAGIIVTGTFEGLKTNLVFDPADLPSSALSGSVDAGTINTGINARNSHLKKEEYFYADKYNLIQVSSVRLYKKGTQFAGLFNITIKGVTRQEEIPFEFLQNGNEAEFRGSFPVNRRDFGIGGSSMFMADGLIVTIDIKAKS